MMFRLIEKYQVNDLLDWAVENFDKVGLLHSTTGYGNFAAQEVGGERAGSYS